MIDLFEELRAVTGMLEEAGIPYALVGGLAYSIWVEARATEDIDLLVLPDDWPRIRELLSGQQYHDLAAPMDLPGIRIRRLTKIEGEAVMVLDLLLADTVELSEGVRQADCLSYEGCLLRVARPSVVISLKRGRMSAKDQIDIEGLSKIPEEGAE